MISHGIFGVAGPWFKKMTAIDMSLVEGLSGNKEAENQVAGKTTVTMETCELH